MKKINKFRERERERNKNLCGKIMHRMRENCKFIVKIWEYKELKIKEDKGIEKG